MPRERITKRQKNIFRLIREKNEKRSDVNKTLRNKPKHSK